MASYGRKTIVINEESLSRFWSRVVKGNDDDCWLWNGPIQSMNHGKYKRGIFYFKGRSIKSHQFSAMITLGQRPDNYETLHSCDNSLCVNPAHLSYGTHAQNTKECTERGRNTLINKTAGKTHCIRGHELFGENLAIIKGGVRRCKKCSYIRKRLHMKGITKKGTPDEWPHGTWD